MMNTLLYLGGALLFLGAVPMLLARWQARRGWTRVQARIIAIDPDGTLVCAVPGIAGPHAARQAPFGEATAKVGDTLVLRHPPGRPDQATNGSAFGYLAAAGLSALLGLACIALLLA